MLDALESWNRDRERAAEGRLAMGIGVNYGPAVVGDVGSEHSMSFTVIGDTVNTADRLQTLTRTLGTPLVVGDALVAAVKGSSPEFASEVMEQLEDQGEQRLARSGRPRADLDAQAERSRKAVRLTHDANGRSLNFQVGRTGQCGVVGLPLSAPPVI